MPELTSVQEDRLFRDTCIECAEPLCYEMESDCRFASCCGFSYSTPHLRGDLVTVEDSEGQVYESAYGTFVAKPAGRNDCFCPLGQGFGHQHAAASG